MQSFYAYLLLTLMPTGLYCMKAPQNTQAQIPLRSIIINNMLDQSLNLWFKRKDKMVRGNIAPANKKTSITVCDGLIKHDVISVESLDGEIICSHILTVKSPVTINLSVENVEGKIVRAVTATY